MSALTWAKFNRALALISQPREPWPLIADNEDQAATLRRLFPGQTVVVAGYIEHS